MKATQLLHNLGQSLWLDNITRDLLNTGTLKRYIDELSVAAWPAGAWAVPDQTQGCSGWILVWASLSSGWVEDRTDGGRYRADSEVAS